MKIYFNHKLLSYFRMFEYYILIQMRGIEHETIKSNISL